jgi:hypothetical protein
LAGPLGAVAAHVPMVWPAAMVHVPVQQSALVAHASLGCTQNEDDWHAPPEHNPEQHAALDVHALPIVAHVLLSAVHVPFAPQVWLQHCPFAVHGPLSDWHAG